MPECERVTGPRALRMEPGDVLFVDLSRKSPHGVWLSHACVIVSDDGESVTTADYGQAPRAGRQSKPSDIGAVLKVRKRSADGQLGGRLPERVIRLDRVRLDNLPDKNLLITSQQWCEENGIG